MSCGENIRTVCMKTQRVGANGGRSRQQTLGCHCAATHAGWVCGRILRHVVARLAPCHACGADHWRHLLSSLCGFRWYPPAHFARTCSPSNLASAWLACGGDRPHARHAARELDPLNWHSLATGDLSTGRRPLIRDYRDGHGSLVHSLQRPWLIMHRRASRSSQTGIRADGPAFAKSAATVRSIPDRRLLQARRAT